MMSEEQAVPSLEDTVSSAMEKQEAAFEKSKPETEPESTPEPEPVEAVKPEEEKPHDTERDAQGRSKPKPEQQKDEEKSEDKQEEQKEAVRPDITRPPKRLPPRLKHMWLSLSEQAREDIHARETEVERAFEPYKGLGRYVQQANSNNTTLQAAVKDYAELESAFRQDPLRGAVYAWQRIGVPPHIINAWINGIASSQDSGQQAQAPQPQPGLTQEQIRALAREELESSRVMSSIETFVRDPKHIHLQTEMLNQDGTIDIGPEMGPLRNHMYKLLNAGLANDLEDAYKQSCIRHGLDPAAQPNGSAAGGQSQKAVAAERSRQAAKATVGAPSSNTPRQQRPDNQADNRSLEQVVADAMARQEGRQ
jgi:hypothetical protein